MRSIAPKIMGLASGLFLLTASGLVAQEAAPPRELGEKSYHNAGPGDGGGDGGGGGDCSGDHVVYARDDFFEPDVITIEVGETVTWCHDGNNTHNVMEEGGTFRCANGCDGSGGNGNPSTGWSFSITFTDARTVNYICEVHEALGMTGTVIVEGSDDGGGGGGGGGSDSPGDLRFATDTYTVDEGTGSVTLAVRRAGGDDGAVGVQVSTSDGSATAGDDYTATTQTLSWPDNDDSNRTVSIPITDDGAAEGPETFTASLSGATGGAGITSPSETTITIQDDDEEQGPGQLSFGSFAFGGVEGGAATIEVVRTGGTGGEVSVEYTSTAGSATSEDDYAPRTGTLQYGNGEATGSINVPLESDGTQEPVESFQIRLSNPSGGATLGPIQTATVLVFDGNEQPAALTSDEVTCDAFRLSSFLGRLDVQAPNTSKTSGVNVGFTRLGDFAGLAYTGNGPGTPEHHLAFSTNPEEMPFLRNPARPKLFAISMSRNQTNSDLVPEGSPDELRVFLNPTLADSPDPASLLSVNDIGDPATREGGTPAESKPGRGLADSVRLCHGKFSSRDQHVFQLLTKIARVSADGAETIQLAAFRGEDPDTYRLDVYPLAASGASMGRLAVELEIDFGPGDRLDGGTLRVLGRCGPDQSAHCTSVDGFTELQLVEPQFRGEFWNDSPFAVRTSGTEGDGQPTSTVDFATLLDGTSWRRPL